MEELPKSVAMWRSKERHYFEYIDEKLTYHLYLRYMDHTEEVYHEDINGNKEYKWSKWGLTYCSGWRPNRLKWESELKSDNEWNDYTSKYAPSVYIEKSFTERKKLFKALPALKYVWVDEEDKYLLWEFIKTLYQYPMMEYIYKNKDTRFLWREERLYKLEGEKKQKVMRYLQLYSAGMWCKNYNELIWCATHPSKRNKEDYEYHLKTQSIAQISKRLDANYVLKRYSAQIKKHGMPKFKMLYKEYLQFSRKLNIDNKYPRNIEKAHDELSNSLALVENKKRLLKAKVYKKYINAINKLKKNKDISLNIPKITGDLIILGNKLHNCVGSYGYDEKMIDGESLIVEVRNNDVPVECCEIDLKKMKIEQLYGDHNSNDGKYHNIARNYINAFIREIRA